MFLHVRVHVCVLCIMYARLVVLCIHVCECTLKGDVHTLALVLCMHTHKYIV